VKAPIKTGSREKGERRGSQNETPVPCPKTRMEIIIYIKNQDITGLIQGLSKSYIPHRWLARLPETKYFHGLGVKIQSQTYS
jgi:hypothetical protein